MMRQFVRFKAYLGKNLWHLAETIQRGAVGLAKVNAETVQGNDGIVGETATRCRGGSFASTTNSIL